MEDIQILELLAWSWVSESKKLAPRPTGGSWDYCTTKHNDNEPLEALLRHLLIPTEGMMVFGQGESTCVHLRALACTKDSLCLGCAELVVGHASRTNVDAPVMLRE